MEKITWRTQRKYFQEFNIIYSKKSLSFTDVQWIVKALYERCKRKKEHLVGDAVHGIIVSVDNINDKKAYFVKKDHNVHLNIRFTAFWSCGCNVPYIAQNGTK